MKEKILTISLVLISIVSYSQTENLLGAWIGQDSKNTISIFIKKDGVISKFSGRANEPILDKNLKKGRYVLENKEKIVISWNDKSIEKGTIKFINKNTIELTLFNEESRSGYQISLKRVVDEDVISN
jgi:hypothetical protein